MIHGGEIEMSDDISHKKAVDLLEKLEGITSYDYKEIKEMYHDMRNFGYDRSDTVKMIWRIVMDRYFDVLFAMDDGWKKEGGIGMGSDKIIWDSDYISESKKYWFFDLITNITGYSEDKILAIYSPALDRNWNLDARGKVTMRYTWNTMMDKYIKKLVRWG